MAPLFEHYGVQLWMPEAGGRVDYASEHDEQAMTVLGLSSKREITRTSIRVRTAMAAQTRQGRYLGGRPPYGYRLADAGPHPNKAHAAWGRRAHRLEPDPGTAHVVSWIFAQRLAGHSVARITRALNDAGIPCPSAADPDRNPHRTAAAWTLGTVTGTVALADRGRLETGPVTAPGTASVFAGFRFPREVISVAVRGYLRYGLSYRDVEELLAERGITVDHVTIYRWVQRFTPEFIEAARPGRHVPGNRWFVDETYLRVAGKWTYLYRAVDQHGQVIDVLVSAKRDLAAARRFFNRALRIGTIPAEVTTDRAAVTRGHR